MSRTLGIANQLCNALLLAGLVLPVGGCGGGGATLPSIGYVIDAPVGGMAYSCGVLNGTTGSDGSFHYDPGTACTFTIGKVTVGAVGAIPSDGIVTPYDLAGVSRSDALNTNAVAIAQFLQSLDDGTQSTHINIPASVVTELSNIAPVSVLSSTLTQTEIQTQLTTLVATATRGAKALVSAQVAAANVNSYLQAAHPKLDVSAGAVPPPLSNSPIEVPNLATVFPATLTASATSVGFSATADVNATGYWEILPASAASPNQWQVVSGIDSNNVAVALSGHGAMAAATTTSFSATGLDYSSSYKLYFVAANANATGKVTPVYSSSITTAAAPHAPNFIPATIAPIDSANGSASFSITPDATGTAYWVVLSAGAAPSAAQVVAGTDSANAAAAIKGSTQMTAGSAASISVAGLAYSTSYTVYLAASNLSDTTKVSQVLNVAITTGPPPPPKITAISSRVTPVGTAVVFNATADAGATGYWVALNATDKDPSAAQVMAGTDASGGAALISGNQAFAAATATNASIEKLAYSTSYKIYFVAATSANGASATAVQIIDVDKTEAAPPTSFTVAGTAASGAAFDGATITIIASDGAKYGGGATDVTGVNGNYTITLPITAKPPFVVLAVRDDKTLASVVAEAKDTNTNITPLTDLIASRLSISGDPVKLADEIKANPALVEAAKLKDKVVEVVALVQPLMDVVGDSTDPLNGKLVADGSGADKVLDSLAISITPSSATTVNIEVSVKTKPATEGENPGVLAFTSKDKTITNTLPTVDPNDLVKDKTNAMIADFLQRMTACYALAQADRVSPGGTAADIIAPACKDIFVGNDPRSYLSNGTSVSLNGAFSGIFGSGTGSKFDRGSWKHTRANGDLAIAFRVTDSSGNVSNNDQMVRKDIDGKLRAIGNQYTYHGSVTPYHQQRIFVNQPAATYYSTGYDLTVNNKLDANGKSIFAKVVVTTPKGAELTLKPTAGYSYLSLVNSVGLTGTTFVRMRSVYADAANSGKNPADSDTSGLFFAATPTTDLEITTYAAHSAWKFDYYLAGNATTSPDATQHYRTRARPMTIPELETLSKNRLPVLTDADISYMKTNSLISAVGTKSMYLPTPATGPLTLNWVVPVVENLSDMAPKSIRLWGSATVSGKTINFDDTASVKSTSRTGDIVCSLASASDAHCSGGNFVPGRLNGAHLSVDDEFGRAFGNRYTFYTITIP